MEIDSATCFQKHCLIDRFAYTYALIIRAKTVRLRVNVFFLL